MARNGTPPAVREDESGIEIDMVRGRWPFLKAQWGENKKGQVRLILVVDCNEGGQVVGENANIAILALSKKKALRLAAFIVRTAELV